MRRDVHKVCLVSCREVAPKEVLPAAVGRSESNEEAILDRLDRYGLAQDHRLAHKIGGIAFAVRRAQRRPAEEDISEPVVRSRKDHP